MAFSWLKNGDTHPQQWLLHLDKSFFGYSKYQGASYNVALKSTLVLTGKKLLWIHASGSCLWFEDGGNYELLKTKYQLCRRRVTQ